MAESYNPIMRTFCQFRAGVLSCIDIDRHAIRPGTPLEALLPVPCRRAIWDRSRAAGAASAGPRILGAGQAAHGLGRAEGTLSAAFSLAERAALLVAVPLAIAVYRANRRRAVALPLGVKNVGELVIYMTRFSEHKDSGYRWTRNEIELKVRFILAESLGLDLDAVRPECTLAELGVY